METSRAKSFIGQVRTPTSEKLPKNMKNQVNQSGIKLIDKIMSHVPCDLMEAIQGHLLSKASQLYNAEEFCSSLINQKVLEEADVVQLTAGPQVQRIEKLINAVCSKKAIGSLVIALQRSDNERILEQACDWLETSQARKNNYPIAVKSLARQQIKAQPKALTFFQQAALADQLSDLGTFQSLQQSTPKGVPFAQFDKNRMMACSADGTLDLWTWQGREQAVKIASNVKNVTSFQYDDEILVLGTEAGTVHLFDVRTLEEKWSIRLREAVISLKFVQSTLVTMTSRADYYTWWWVDISRPHMRLVNPRSMREWAGCKSQIQIPGVLLSPHISFVYSLNNVHVYDTKSGRQMSSDNQEPCYLTAPDADFIRALNVGDLISRKRVVVAGFIGGLMAMWNTCKLMPNQRPVKTFQGHRAAIASLCFLNGHLLSLDKRGKLLMWSGYDLENSMKPVPRLLIEKSNWTYLTPHERWFATSSFKDNSINIWTLPDLWLRTG